MSAQGPSTSQQKPQTSKDTATVPQFSIPTSQPQSKYSQLLAVIEELGKDIRPTYSGNKMSAERLKRSIIHARILTCYSWRVMKFSVSTQRNQQKLVYRGRCYTLKQTNRNDKCWICTSGTRGCFGKLYTRDTQTFFIIDPLWIP
ncbi:Cyclin-dependent kinase 2-associated protein 1 [Trichinella patagoniensis]|uniref:Cyclin-dependent kinase 2-associated protein 1 n=1 Tax=Trichinella patagoniensis TaxID=990121 RepID=A0A0V0Z487_9BILA|nr:Cyclin-dependent kinase 2-associated protein 1 [Trichinella patagoniensis]